jgi:polysaccharide export outer membrane protein
MSLLLLGAVAVLGCASRRPVPEVPGPPPAEEAAAYRLQPGDQVEVKFEYHEKESQKVVIRPDGYLSLPITGDLQAAGLTVDQLARLIERESSRYLRDPVVAVSITENGARVYVGGEVTSQGFVALGKPTTVLQAIVERGGFKAGADPGEVVVISQTEQGRVTRRIDLDEVLDGDAPDVELLAPNDIVFVPLSEIARANRWVDQWINGLTPDILRAVRIPTGL